MSSISANGGDIINISQVGGTIYYNINGGTNTSISSWPVTVVNTNTSFGNVKLHFTDLSIESVDSYFIAGSDNIQFGNISLNPNGARPIININSVTGYPGLIKNTDKNNIVICNLEVSSSDSSLVEFGGWVAQQSFARAAGITNYIINCSSDGSVPIGGGIVGSDSVFGGATLIIYGCDSSGELNAGAGGIIGSISCDGSGSILIIEQCSSSGPINNESGGIVGYLSVKNGASCTVKYCYSSYRIDSGSGGIYGSQCGDIASNTNAENCYSQGTIFPGGGGIFGKETNKGVALNCYSSGDTNDDFLEGIFGPLSMLSSQLNCYIANNNWSDSTANTSLTGFGTTWLSLATNTPYILNNFGSSPYTLNNILPSYELAQTYSQTVQAGEQTIGAVVAGYTTFIILSGAVSGITINSSGVISTTSSVPAGTYTLLIYADGVYSTTIFNLTVIGTSPASIIPPCCETSNCISNPQTTDFDANVITNKKQDKLIVSNANDVYSNIASGTRTAYSQPIFRSYYEYMNYLKGKCRY
jgi:hypothetical protein